MNAKEQKLAAKMINDYSDKLSNNGCNDWDFQKDWSEQEKRTFIREYHDWNGDPEEYDQNSLFIQNDSVAAFLASKLWEDF